eukprot:Nk52_evm39s236 gene=Nk52_evmTU39s236
MEVPNLKDYDVSPLTGFLPEKEPLGCLPEYFKPWEDIAGDIGQLVLTGNIRDKVLNQLPLLDYQKLESTREKFRGALLLGIIGSGYVWGEGEVNVARVLPRNVAIPWCGVCDVLGLPPVITHSCLVLYNWRLVDKSRPMTLNNIAMHNVMCGGIDEAWFYIVTVAIEAEGGDAAQAMVGAQKAVLENDSQKLLSHLRQLKKSLVKMNEVMEEMHQKLDPHIFYTRIRPFLAGWKNSKLLPDGLIYEGVSETPMCYSGGSAAQSSLVQAFDVIFDIEHFATKEAEEADAGGAVNGPTPAGRTNSFLRDMRNYMPLVHRNFLKALEGGPCIRDYIVSLADKEALLNAFNEGVEGLEKFRSKHIQMVTRYIMIPAQKNKCKGSLSDRGTGGTDLMPFLKQARNETSEKKIPSQPSNSNNTPNK